MSSAPTKDKVIRSIVSVAAISVSFGILLMLGIQRLLAHDPVYMLIAIFVLLPLLIAAIVVTARRILKLIP